MSRSYRKPCIQDNERGGSKKAKKQAHKHLRRSKNIMECGQNCNYKKYFCRWDIHDYKWVIFKSYEHSSWRTFYQSTEKKREEDRKEYYRMIARAKRK